MASSMKIYSTLFVLNGSGYMTADLCDSQVSVCPDLEQVYLFWLPDSELVYLTESQKVNLMKDQNFILPWNEF